MTLATGGMYERYTLAWGSTEGSAALGRVALLVRCLGVDQVGYIGEVVRAVCSYRAALVQRQKSSRAEVQDEVGQ